MRDKIGSFREREEMERWLNDWVMNYVDGDPANSSRETKSRKPLAAAEVQVQEIEDNPATTPRSSSCVHTTSWKV